jgi:hypothetical protein
MNRWLFTFTLCVVPLALSGCIIVDDDDPPPRGGGGGELFVYDPCGFTSDCELLADSCFDVTVDYGSEIITDGMCSLYCDFDDDCPAPGACLSINGEEPICYETCVDDLDCPSGFACIDTVDRRSIVPVCLPF